MKTHLFLLALAATAHAAPRTSADYALTAEALDFAGRRTASADYTNDGSLGEITGLSAEATAPTLAKHGYIGQLYDLLGFGLLAVDYYPPELGTTQLFPVRSADDGTNVLLATAGVAWSVVSGPVSGIDAAGLATAGAVFQNTTATVRATLGAEVADLPIHIQDTLPDNFGSYAGDGLADAWQHQYFGLDNPLAAPALDPDGDGQTNLFEFTAGLVPTDQASRFELRIEPVPGEPTQRRLLFRPRLDGRDYVVKAKPSLASGAWEILGAAAESDSGDVRSVTDLGATGTEKFYRVEITRP